MAQITKKAASAQAQRQGGTLLFGSKPETDPETSDGEWLNDSDNDSEIDEEDNRREMASLYSAFLPRHLQPKIVVFRDEKKV